MIASIEDVELFLKNIKDKLRFSGKGIVYRPRDKNMDALGEIDIVPAERDEIIKKLTAKDYFAGPKPDTYNPSMPDYYEFGVIIKGKEIYIKLSLGLLNKPINCMSFHVAERSIDYPHKKRKNENKN